MNLIERIEGVVTALFQGPWSWYHSEDEGCEDAILGGTRKQAIIDGTVNFGREPFHIVEARVSLFDHWQMRKGKREWAKFTSSRNGEWIEAAALRSIGDTHDD